MSERCVEPEWLDELPADDPRAVRSRRDLRLLNRIMGHAGILRRVMRAHVHATPPRIAELGAGDGTLMLRIAANFPEWTATALTLVDQQPVVSADTMAAYAERKWSVDVRTADVFEWLENEPVEYDAVVANLFLHHFQPSQLARLFALAESRTKLFVACEPERSRFALGASRLVGLIGCNDVTRHDAVLSVRAGFRGEELSQLWPQRERWVFEEGGAGLFSHRFVAVRVV